MRLKVLTISMVATFLLLPILAQKSTGDEKAKLTKFLARLFNTDQKSVTIESLTDSTLLKGAKEGAVTIGRQKGSFFVVGQKLILGSLYDLNSDPYKDNMKKISLRGRPLHGNGPVTLVEYSDFQ